MKIKDGNFEMPCMELVTFSSEDVICTSGGCTGKCNQVCENDCIQVCQGVCHSVNS